MSKVLDNFFNIRNIIVNSDVPLSNIEISEATDIKIRSVQRYTIRLANEKMVDFRWRGGVKGYEYARQGMWGR